MKVKDLKKLRERGLLPDPQIYEWVATKGQEHPTPRHPSSCSLYCAFQVRLRGFPSKFLERIRRHYGIKLVHLLPNAVAMLSVFAFLCEALKGPCLVLVIE
jgi:hypothetical protein